MSWFATWFDSPYYHILYQNRDDKEARFLIDNLLEEYPSGANARLLDLACGKGRHSIYLASKGYEVVGLDLSEQSIGAASEQATDKLQFFVHDMRRHFRSNYFEVIYNFFTSFGYFASERDHRLTLDSIAYGLKPGGIFVMDFMNGKKAMDNLVPREEKTVQGITFHIRRRVDGGVIVKDIRFSDKGRKYHFQERVRAFSLSDMARLFRQSGLMLLDVYGDYALQPYQVFDSDRMVLVAKKG